MNDKATFHMCTTCTVGKGKLCIHRRFHKAAKALPTSKNFLLHDKSLVAILAE